MERAVFSCHLAVHNTNAWVWLFADVLYLYEGNCLHLQRFELTDISLHAMPVMGLYHLCYFIKMVRSEGHRVSCITMRVQADVISVYIFYLRFI